MEDYHPWLWPAPAPRLWAYGRLFQNKLLSKLQEHGDTRPVRWNAELPVLERLAYFWSRDPTEVLPGLFVGSAKNAADSASLDRNNIRVVVNATRDIDNFFEGRKSGEIRYARVPIQDTRDGDLGPVQAELDAAVEAIHEAAQAGAPVLVHCFMGASRSVAVLCAYMIRHRHMAFAEAYAMIRAKRKCAAINVNFKRWLEANEPEANATSTEALEDPSLEAID